MYTQQDIEKAQKKWRGYVLQACLAAAVMLALLCVALLVRIEWLAYAAPIAYIVYFVASFGLYGAYTKRYAKYLREMEKSLKKQHTVTYEGKLDDVVFRDGLPYTAFSGVRDDGDTMQLYFDAFRPFPAFEQGDRLAITVIGSMVIAWEKEA